jgi:predicted Zn-dependent peptidase
LWFRWDLENEVEKATAYVAAQHGSPTAVMVELLHGVAYQGGLGSTFLPDVGTLSKLTPEGLHSFLSASLVPSQLFLSGAGVDHEELKRLAGR